MFNDATRRCPNCGHENPLNARRCLNCGHSLVVTGSWMRGLRGLADDADTETAGSVGDAPPPPPGFEGVPTWLDMDEPVAVRDQHASDFLNEPAWQPPETGTLDELPDWLTTRGDLNKVKHDNKEGVPVSGPLPDWLTRDYDLPGDETDSAMLPTDVAPEPDNQPDALPEMPASSGMTSWLSRDLPREGGAASQTGSGPLELPSWLSAEDSAPLSLDDEAFFASLPAWGEADQPDEAPPPDEPASANLLAEVQSPGDIPENPPALPTDDDDDLPDWLRGELTEPPRSSHSPLTTTGLALEEELDEPLPQTGDLPAWLRTELGKGERPDDTPPAAEPPPLAPAPGDVAGDAEDDLPDWLTDDRAMGRHAAAALKRGGKSEDDVEPRPESGWLTDGLADDETGDEPVEPDEALPAWLSDSAELARGDTPGIEQDALPDWLADAPEASDEMAGPAPDWLVPEEDDNYSAGDDILPAWLTGEGKAPGVETGILGGHSVESTTAGEDVGSPEELFASFGDSEPETQPAPDDLPDLFGEPASFAPTGEGDDADELLALLSATAATIAGAERQAAFTGPEADASIDLYEESVGPLAGMRGVLRAEPSISVYGAPGATIREVDANARQQTQVRRLLGMLDVEDRSVGLDGVESDGLRIEFDRLFVHLMVLSIGLAPFLVGALLSAWWPMPEVLAPASPGAAFFQAVETHTATDRAALLVFDFAPAYQGEVGMTAATVLRHLGRRGVPVDVVSSQPAGVALAELYLDQQFAFRLPGDDLAPAGASVFNLGLIPGGATGIGAFVRDPRVVQGTALSRVSAVLTGPPPVVGSLDGYGVVVLLSDSPETLRLWLEQLGAAGVATPVVAAVPASAGPLAAPWFRPDGSGQLAGYIASPDDAFGYAMSVRDGVQDDVLFVALNQQRWDVRTLGQFASLVVLGAGLLLGGGLRLIQQVRRGGGRS